MEHPLISGLNDLTQDQLNEKISELHKKLSIAMQTGNGHLCNQLRMALESYNNKYQERSREEMAKNPNFADKINIK